MIGAPASQEDSMKASAESLGTSLIIRFLIGGLAFMAMILVGIRIANAGEFIPSVGITRPADSDNDESKVFGGLAVRGHLTPIIKTEIGAAYRSESRFNDNLDIKMWPVTASLWLTPVSSLYVGGGVGWYHTTFDYDDALPMDDETHQEFGVHLGGGLTVPLNSTSTVGTSSWKSRRLR